mgnify:CR=1 FL=1
MGLRVQHTLAAAATVDALSPARPRLDGTPQQRCNICWLQLFPLHVCALEALRGRTFTCMVLNFEGARVLDFRYVW